MTLCYLERKFPQIFHHPIHGLRTPGEKIAFTARPKINSHFQIFRYRRSIFCLPHRPKFSDLLDLCLHWVSVVRSPWSYLLLTCELLQQITILKFESKPQFAFLLFLNRTLNLILGPKVSKHPFCQNDRLVVSNWD